MGVDGTQITELPDYCFYNCTGLRSNDSQTVPALSGMGDAITTLGKYCFAGCNNNYFTDLSGLSDGLTTLGEDCFNGCSGLVTLKGLDELDRVEALPKNCFRGCTGLVYACGGEGYSETYQTYFQYALPVSLRTIGTGCFKDCPNLKHVGLSRYEHDSGQITQLVSNADTIFDMTYNSALSQWETNIDDIWVSDSAAVPIYKADARWGVFADRISYRPLSP